MQEVLEAIERHLGRTIPISQLDYYQVIGLELYCNDPQQIRKALQEATNRWMQSETGKYPESAQIIAKLLKQAQTILLDPERRERYNLQLEKLRSSQAEVPQLARGAGGDKSVSDREDKGDREDKAEDAYHLFPNADPMAPFSFESAASSSFSRDSSCALLERIRDPQSRLAELELLFPSLSNYEYAPSEEDSNVNSYSAPSLSSFSPIRDGTSGGLSLAQQMARRRKRKRIILSLLFFFGSQAILGVAIWAYMRDQSRLASKNKRLADGQWQADNPENPKLPSISKGAKDETGIFPSEQPPAEENANSKNPSSPDEPKRNQSNRSRQPGSKPEVMPGSKDLQMAAPEPAEETKPQPDSNPTSPSVPAPDDPTAMPDMKPSPEKSPAGMESETPTEESKDWKKLMLGARSALDQAKFETFEKEIAKATETAQTPAGSKQAARLDQLGQLYKIGNDSFEEAKKKLKGTSSLRMGSSAISIVENSPERLVVKVSGKNQIHPWEKLPFGIAIAMLDLTLDSEKPTDVAARAVFFSLAPQFRESAAKSDLLKKRIATWFEKSAGKEQILSDLPQALTDSFE
jgi:hypothetical protein